MALERRTCFSPSPKCTRYDRMLLRLTLGSFSANTVIDPMIAIAGAMIRGRSSRSVCCTIMPPKAHAAALVMYITTVAFSIMTVNSFDRFSSRRVSYMNGVSPLTTKHTPRAHTMFDTMYCQNSVLNPNVRTPTENSTSPRNNTALRPYLSPISPAGIWSPIIVPQKAASTTVMRKTSSRFSYAHRVQKGIHRAKDVTALKT